MRIRAAGFGLYLSPFVLAVVIVSSSASSAAAQPAGRVHTGTISGCASSSTTAAASTKARPTVRPEDARGRIDDGIEPEDAWLFLPRALLFVPQYALRLLYLPLQGLLWLEDEFLVSANVIDVLYNDDRTIGVLPRLMFLPGLGFSAGLSAFNNNVFGDEEYAKISLAYGGLYQQSYQLKLGAPRIGGTAMLLQSELRFERAPALLYREADGPESRFQQERLFGLLRAGAGVAAGRGRFEIAGFGVFNRRVFGPAVDRGPGELSIEQAYDITQIVGFTEEVHTLELGVDFFLDTRAQHGLKSGGLVARGFISVVPKLDDFLYAHWGLEVASHIDLFNANRVLVLSAAIESVEGRSAEIPFSDLPRLGGPHRLIGYPLDTFRGEKSAFASIAYQYPIHANLSGHLFVGTGRVAGNYGELFGDGPTKFRFGYGGGLLLGSADSVTLRFDVAYGDTVNFFISGGFADAFDGWLEEL